MCLYLVFIYSVYNEFQNLENKNRRFAIGVNLKFNHFFVMNEFILEKYIWLTTINFLRIYSQLQNFTTKAIWLTMISLLRIYSQPQNFTTKLVVDIYFYTEPLKFLLYPM